MQTEGPPNFWDAAKSVARVREAGERPSEARALGMFADAIGEFWR